MIKTAPPARHHLRRPLLGVACAVMAGIAWGLYQPLSPAVLLFLAAGLLLPATLFRKSAVGLAALYLSCLASGGAVASLHARNPSPRHLSHLLENPRECVEVCGTIVTDPADGRYGHNALFTLEVEGLRRLQQWQRSRGRVRVYVSEDPSAVYRYGQRWRFVGMLSKEDAAHGKPGFFLRADRKRSDLLGEGGGRAIVRWCLRGRSFCSDVLSRGLEHFPEHTALLRALLLGHRKALPPSLRDVFASTGTLHIFAISGLHVGVMGLLFVAVLKMAGVSRQNWVTCLAPLLLIYTLSTGLKTSAVRACLMATFYWGAGVVRRRPDGPSALAGAALCILAVAPAQLFEPGFVLSFTVVAGILVLYPRFIGPLRRLVQPDPWRLQAEPMAFGYLRRGGMFFAELAAVSAAAWLVSAPLTAYYFNLFSPIGLLGNLFVVPGAFLVVFTGCLSLVIGSSFAFFAEVFNHANRLFISMLLEVVRRLGDIPAGHLSVRAPPLYMVLLWYGMLAALVMGRRRVRVTTLLLAIACVIGTGVVTARDKEIEIDVLDVDQGHAALVDLPGGTDVLIDAGPVYCATRVLDHLQSKGINSVDILVLTHPDADHVGGALQLLEYMSVGEIWCPLRRSRSSVYRRVMRRARAKGIPVRVMYRGEKGMFPDGTAWEILHPDREGKYHCGDDASLVLRIARGGAGILFMGGAQRPVEETLLNLPTDLATPILMTGNHGGPGGTTASWLDAVAPEWAIISVGARNRDGHPGRNVLHTLKRHAVRTWRTDELGGVRIRWPHPAARRWPAPAFSLEAIAPLH